MGRNERMLRTTIIYFIGNFSSKLLSFFLLPLYTNWLNPDKFGKIDLILSIIPLIGPIFTLQVTECIFRFLFECKTEQEKKDNITNALVVYFIGIIAFVVCFSIYCYITKFEYSLLFSVYFVLLYLGIFLQQVMRAFSFNTSYAVTGIISTLVQGVTNVLLIRIIAEKSLLIAPLLAALFIVLFGVIRTKLMKYIDFKMINIETIKRQLKFSIPLVPNQICWWFTGAVGKYIINFFIGTVATGILAVATKFPNLIAVVMQIYFLAWVENSIFEFNSSDRDKYFSNNLNGLIEFLMFCMAGLLLVIRIYFKYTIDVNYYEALTIIPILFGAMLFNSVATFFGSIYTASKQTKEAFSTTVYAALSNIIASFLLIPLYGLMGYAFANFISYLIFACVRYKSIKKICDIKLKIPTIISIITLIFSVFMYYLESVYFWVIGILFIIISFVINYRNVLIILMDKIKNSIVK